MNENKEFKPYIPAEKVTAEMTVTSVIMGVILAIVFGAANAYLGLRVGMTVSASIPAAVISQRINGRSPWEWREVGRVCQALDITYDDFALYFPSGIVRPTTKEPTREERVDNLLAQIREVLIERV